MPCPALVGRIRNNVIGRGQLWRAAVAVQESVVFDMPIEVAQQIVHRDAAHHLKGWLHPEPRREHQQIEDGSVAGQGMSVFLLRGNPQNLGEILAVDVLGCRAVKAANRQELLALAQHERLIGLDVLQRGQLHMAHIHPARRCHAHGQLLGLGQERVFHRGQLGDDVHAFGILRPGHVAPALLHQGEFGLHPGQGSSLGQRYRRHRHLQRIIALGHHLGHALAVKRRLLHIHGPR